MEKKGNILTQLALISDLFERANMVTTTVSTFLTVDETEFARLFNLFSKKANARLNVNNDKFTVKIGVVEYIFTLNKNSV